MTEINVTQAELAGGRLTDTHLRAAIQAVYADGFVVLIGVIDTEHLDALQARMVLDLESILHLEKPPFNFVRGHIQHDPPPFPPFLYKDVLLNELVIQVTHAVLGRGLTNSFFSGNTSLPGSAEQPAHVDCGQLWPGLEKAHPPCELVVNICPIDMHPGNGSIELWPGTHLDTTLSRQDSTLKLSQNKLEERRKFVPPLQPSIPKGGVLIRDMRVWHRGMSNRSCTPRPMIAMIHKCAWMSAGKITFPKGTESFFQHSVLNTRVEFVDGAIDYLTRNHPYDYHDSRSPAPTVHGQRL